LRKTKKNTFFMVIPEQRLPLVMTKGNCFKHLIFRKRSTLFSRMYFYLIFRLFVHFFGLFRLMPLILIQKLSPAFKFRRLKFFIFITHNYLIKKEISISYENFINLSPVRFELTF
jgi:hypothetical protein